MLHFFVPPGDAAITACQARVHGALISTQFEDISFRCSRQSWSKSISPITCEPFSERPQDPPPRSTSPKKVPDRLAFVRFRPRIHELNRARGRTSVVVFSRSKSRIPRNRKPDCLPVLRTGELPKMGHARGHGAPETAHGDARASRDT